MMSVQRHRRGRSTARRPRPRGLRVRAAARLLVAVLLVGSLSVALSWALPGLAELARADDGSGTQTGGKKVAFFEDVTVGRGETYNLVVVVGGNAIVEGTVTDVVVVVGGDLTVRASANIGSEHKTSNDGALISVFGNVTIEPGAVITGRVIDVGGKASGALNAAVVNPIVRPWTWTSIAGWIGSTIFLLILALIVAAIAPRQVAVVGDRVRRHFPSSLGWGVLGAVIIVPVVTILLIITIVGILVVLPWLFIVVPLMFLFGFVAAAALVGRLVVGKNEDDRGRVMLAVLIGVLILSVVRWIPVAGAVITCLAVLAGFGALWAAVWRWRHPARTPGQAAVIPPGMGAPPGGPTGMPQSWQTPDASVAGPQSWQAPAAAQPPADATYPEAALPSLDAPAGVEPPVAGEPGGTETPTG